MQFLELFEPIQKGNFGLTEEAVYRSIQLGNTMIPLWGGNQQHRIAERFVDEKARTKYDEPIKVFSAKGIIISLDGSSGNMTYKSNERFALNHHAGFFTKRKESEKLIDLEFFSIFYGEQLKKESISEGSHTLTLDKIYSIEFDIPQKNIQLRVLSKLRPILDKYSRIQSLITKISLIQKQTLSHEYVSYQGKDIPIPQILSYTGGNSGLTEKEVYQKILMGGKKFRILSGATLEENEFGYVSVFNLKGKPIKTFENKEGILVIRKGKAGITNFIEKGNYTLTDDAYILFKKQDCKYEISLRWLRTQYSNLFLEYSSSSDNGTWNLSRFFENARIDIPSYSEQLMIVEKYNNVEMLKRKLIVITKNIESLLRKVLSDITQSN